MMKNAVGYIRVSTENQAGEDKFGIDAQKDAIERYAKEHDYAIKQWFVDVVSGVAKDKPEWEKILNADDVANPPFQAVIVFKDDRVSRDMQQYFYDEYRLMLKGVEIVSVNETFKDVPSEYKNIIKSFILFCAEQERKNIALRTSRGRKMKAIAGGYAGGRPAYGYKVDNGALVLDENEAFVVREIFAQYDDGISQYQVAKNLNNRGFRTRKGQLWSNNNLRFIIKNRKFYQGYVKYGSDEWVKGVHQPII